MIYCGVDWAESHHDVALVNDAGDLLAKRRILDNAEGYRVLMDLLVEYGDSPSDPIPVCIETSRGLLVALLNQGGRQVYAINPMAAARYRDRHGVSRKKSDPGDALVLANILRTDRHVHRPIPADTPQVRAVAILARAQQDAQWNRQQMSNQVRSMLREYYPAALDAFSTWTNPLCRPEAREILRLAPTPARAARLTRAQLCAALRRAGRQRGIEAEAERIKTVLRGDYARQAPEVEVAMGHQLLGLLLQLDAACTAADHLAEEAESAFRDHPDSTILLSFPGVGAQLGARILAELGDDRSRFADARSLKAYAGSAPITRASGKKHHVGRRMVKNDRLNHAGYLWSFAALTKSEGANAHYRARRERGDWHAAGLRHLFNRMIGQLYHCLQAGEVFEEHRAFPSSLKDAA
ncbi:IS110 family RNA-guided transposase [Streptomyces griseofuscus]|uniref:IS110 family transposase n=1 Tax=Streptomyces griseofuscus TaxID=146922 RepID=UPI00368E4CB6